MPGRRLAPRLRDGAVKELADSIRAQGVLLGLLVRPLTIEQIAAKGGEVTRIRRAATGNHRTHSCHCRGFYAERIGVGDAPALA
jgi:hypothetical protein